MKPMEALNELQTDLNILSDAEQDHYGNKWKSWYNVRLNTLKQYITSLEGMNEQLRAVGWSDMVQRAKTQSKLDKVREIVEPLLLNIKKMYDDDVLEKLLKIKEVLDK